MDCGTLIFEQDKSDVASPFSYLKTTVQPLLTIKYLEK